MDLIKGKGNVCTLIPTIGCGIGKDFRDLKMVGYSFFINFYILKFYIGVRFHLYPKSRTYSMTKEQVLDKFIERLDTKNTSVRELRTNKNFSLLDIEMALKMLTGE